jgi:sialic acid synthase SpsE
LGAVALGAKVIEKHFTLNNNDKGPDHPHSMELAAFANMIRRIQDMESALGSSRKEVVAEEAETVIVQRRSLYAAEAIKQGELIRKERLIALRPAIGIYPKFINVVATLKARRDIEAGEPVRWIDLE